MTGFACFLGFDWVFLGLVSVGEFFGWAVVSLVRDCAVVMSGSDCVGGFVGFSVSFYLVRFGAVYFRCGRLPFCRLFVLGTFSFLCAIWWLALILRRL